MHPEITIQLLGWNSAAVLPRLLPTLSAIPASQAAVRYIDNHSQDDSVRLVREHLPTAEIIALPENIGYTGGHNVGLAACQTPFVLVLNPDVILDWEGIASLMELMRANPRVAAAQGLLLRPGEENIVDSAGIVRTITLNGVDRGAGKPNGPTFAQQAEVDATTGACSLFRLRAFQQVSHSDYQVGEHAALEVFDKAFFAYKEDVDLGWRLQTAGWKIMFVPTRVGTHGRALKPSGRLGWSLAPKALLTRLRNRRTAMSLRNYIWLVVKNASFKQLLLHEVFIDLRLAFFFGLALVYWPLLATWREALRGLPNMLHKRRHEIVNNHR